MKMTKEDVEIKFEELYTKLDEAIARKEELEIVSISYRQIYKLEESNIFLTIELNKEVEFKGEKIVLKNNELKNHYINHKIGSIQETYRKSESEQRVLDIRIRQYELALAYFTEYYRVNFGLEFKGN